MTLLERPRKGEAERLPAPVRLLLGASFVSDIGAGLTMPLLLIYLHEVRHISLGASGLLIGGAMVFALPVGPLTGTLVDRFGPKAIAIAALAEQGVGTVALVMARGPVSAIVPMLLYGIGQAAAWPAWNALLATAVSDPMRPRVFALTFQLLNFGLGAGAVVTGMAVAASHPAGFELVYLVDGLTTLLLAAVLAALPGSVFARKRVAAGTAAVGPVGGRTEDAGDRQAGYLPQAGTSPGHPGGYRQVLADARFRRFLVVMLVLAMAGYGAVSTGLVGFATTVVGATPRTIAWAFAANTATIVLLQPLGLRLARRMRRTTALSLVATIWAISWCLLELAGAFPRSVVGDTLVVVMFAVFATGEVLLSPVAAPLVNDLAPEELRGRYNALSSTMYSLASVVTPAIAGALLGARLGRELLELLVVCCAVSVGGFRTLRRRLHAGEDKAPPGAPRPGSAPADCEPVARRAGERGHGGDGATDSTVTHR